MAPRASGRLGAFSHRQVELQREIAGQSRQEREAAAELARMGLAAPKSVFLERKVTEERQRTVEWDESGFFPEDDALIYVTPSEASRDDGEECDVVFKRIAIRKLPHTEGRVLGAACEGERLHLFDWDETRTWRKLHFRLRGGWGGLVEAWVLMRHPQLGTLVRAPGEAVVRSVQERAATVNCHACGHPLDAEAIFCSKCGAKQPEQSAQQEVQAELPRPRQSWLGAEQPRGIRPGSRDAQAASTADGNLALLTTLELGYFAAKENESGEPDAEEGLEGDSCRRVSSQEITSLLKDGAMQYEVVYSPFIAVRSLPSTEGLIKGTAMFKQRVDTFGWDESAQWRRVLGKAAGADRVVEAWVLVEKEGVGPLLQLVPELQPPLEASDDFVMMG